MKPKTMREALEHIIRRLQMDIDDGSRPDHWSMQDLVRVANDALAHDQNPWRQAVDEALIAHALDCTGPGDDPKEKVKELIEWAVTIATDPRVAEQAVTAAREQEASATGAEPAAWQERQQTDYFDGWTSWYDTNSTKVVGKTEAFEVKSSGVRYQFRPLFTYRHLREYAAIARQQGRNEILEWKTARVRAEAFAAGWRTAANWMERDDLIADIGSPAYIRDRDEAIGTPKSAEGEGA